MLQMPSGLIATWRLTLLTANSLMESFLHPATHPTPQRPSANTLHQQTIGVISKRPLISISDLPFLLETKSEIKRQRIAQATLEVADDCRQRRGLASDQSDDRMF
ncbi:hypothetical protein GJ744_006468 [Endocarpon pusillum]|uniref:Uncharacterized protein n=1 Tax=Endocarpon pusillum TaxID=364733 RepID=A0A8H7AT26_9EURO|nr:hypothetical protein GJ744_006468 [Endocarpon pusillum]